MKKLLLPLLVAAGVAANAQYSATQNFDDPSNTNYAYFGTGATTTTVFCSGTTSFTESYSATNASGGPFIDFTNSTTQTNNGQKVDVSVNFRKTGGAGTLYLIYALYDPSSDSYTVTPFASKSITTAAVTTCTNFSGTIPAGTLDPTKQYGIGVYFLRSSGSGAFYFDDLTVNQQVVTTAPGCTTVTAPAAGSTVNYGSTTISWSAANTAVNYDVKVGTTSGGADVFNGTVSGTSQLVSTNPNSTYYVTVTPKNLNGSASGCPETSFNTNNSLQYCTAGSSGSSAASYEYITNVKFAGINNTTVKNAAVGYTDYSGSNIASVAQSATVPISVTATIDANDYLTAFFDWNHNGSFSADEAVVLTSNNSTSGSATFTGNVAVPANAVVGNTKMRVIIKYSSAPTGCDGTFSYGEVEDYGLTVTGSTLGTNSAAAEEIAIYPNPFHDILKISGGKEIKSITISDYSGKLVKSLPAADTADLSGLNPGAYMVVLNMKDGSHKTFKAIKK